MKKENVNVELYRSTTDGTFHLTISNVDTYDLILNINLTIEQFANLMSNRMAKKCPTENYIKE